MVDLNAICIIWKDSTRYDCGWTRDPEEKMELHDICSVGHLVHEDSEKYVITHTLSDDGDCLNTMVIPKGCVVDTYPMRTYKPRKSNRKTEKTQNAYVEEKRKTQV
jgi:hypothetical protein